MTKKPFIRAFFDEPTNTVSYLVADPETKRAAVIDPVLDYDHASGKASTKSADAILAAAAAEGLHRRLGARDARPCRSSLRRALHQAQDRRQGRHRRAYPRRAEDLPPGVQRHRPQGRRQRVRPPVRRWRDASSIGNLEVEVLHMPGHTPADVAYKIERRGVRRRHAVHARLRHGARRLSRRRRPRALPLDPASCWRCRRETRLFMCHDYKAPGRDHYAWETTVGEERANNVARQGWHRRGRIRRHARGARRRSSRRRCC